MVMMRILPLPRWLIMMTTWVSTYGVKSSIWQRPSLGQCGCDNGSQVFEGLEYQVEEFVLHLTDLPFSQYFLQTQIL